MRKKIKWMILGTLVAAAICLACGLLQLMQAATYVSIIGVENGGGPLEAILYVVSESFCSLSIFFVLMAIACVEYILMNLGRRPEKKVPGNKPDKRQSPVSETNAGAAAKASDAETKPQEEMSDREKPRKIPINSRIRNGVEQNHGGNMK